MTRAQRPGLDDRVGVAFEDGFHFAHRLEITAGGTPLPVYGLRGPR